MDDLEVIDVAILLIEVTVTVNVISILLVERVEVLLDLRLSLSVGNLVGRPLVDRVANQVPNGRANVRTADVFWP